jgi:hypothetical protein
LLLRRSLEKIDLSVVGEPSYSCDLELSLKSDQFALEVLRRHGHGKLVLHAWLSRGYVTIDKVMALSGRRYSHGVCSDE